MPFPIWEAGYSSYLFGTFVGFTVPEDVGGSAFYALLSHSPRWSEVQVLEQLFNIDTSPRDLGRPVRFLGIEVLHGPVHLDGTVLAGIIYKMEDCHEGSGPIVIFHS